MTIKLQSVVSWALGLEFVLLAGTAAEEPPRLSLSRSTAGLSRGAGSDR